ncbi:unnamed protein product, partial [Closterium sp. NIES-53]
FENTSGAAPAPPATADIATRSLWLTCEAEVMVGAAVEVVEAVEVVAGVGVVVGVGALVKAVVAAVGVAVVAAVGVVAVGLELLSVEVQEAARGSSSNIGARPRRPSSFAELLRSGVAIFDLDYDAIFAAMYALSVSAEGDCYLCVPPDQRIEAAALGASESSLPGNAPAEALHTFTLDSDASRCFFRDSTTLTLSRSGCTAALQDAMVTTTTPGGQCVLICTCTRTGRHLATSLPPLPPWPASPFLPCVEGRQRAAPHSSSFPPTTAPLQILHMDVWGPARVSGQGRERYFLLVVDDYTRYTTVFPLRSKGQAVDVLIPWIRTVRLQLRERFGQDLPVLRLHSDRGGEFSSNLLREFCHGEGILQSFTLPDSPKKNGIAERRIGLVMEVALRCASAQPLAPCLLARDLAHTGWTGEVGDASVFRVWGSRAFVRDTSADKLSPRAILCVFLGFVPDAPGWQFYHPTSRRVLPSQDVTFDEPVPSTVSSPTALSLPRPRRSSLLPVVVGSGAARSAASGGAASGGGEPRGADSEGAETGGAEPGGLGTGGAELGGAELEGVEPRGAASKGAESGGAEPEGAASSGGSAGALPRLSPQQLPAGAGGAGGARAARASSAGGAAATGPGGARTRCTGAVGTGGVEGAGVVGTGTGGAGAAGDGVGGTGYGGTGAIDPCTRGTGGSVRPRPHFVPLLQLVLGTPSSLGLTPPLFCPPPDQSQPPLQLVSPLPAPSPYIEQSSGLTERREPTSCPVSPVRTARCAPRSRPPPIPGTCAMALRPPSVPMRVPLPTPPESSLPEVPDLESDRARAVSPTVSLLLATAVTDPSFESAAASALVAELLEFAAACRLDYTTALVTESSSASPPVKRPLGSPPAFKARYVARGFSQRQGVDYFQTSSPTPKMTTLRVLLHVAAQRDYDLRQPVYGLHHSPREWHNTLRATFAALGFAPSTADPSLFPCTDTSLPPFYVLVYILQRFGFQFSSPQPTPLSTSHSLSAPPSDESVELSGPYPELVGCFITSGMGLVLGGRGPVVLTDHADASWVDDSATQRSSQGYTFSLGSGSLSWRSTRSSLVLSSSWEAEIYAGAMAAQELRWLTYLLTDLGEQPGSPLLALLFLTGLMTTCSPPLCLWGPAPATQPAPALPAPPPEATPFGSLSAPLPEFNHCKTEVEPWLDLVDTTMTLENVCPEARVTAATHALDEVARRAVYGAKKQAQGPFGWPEFCSTLKDAFMVKKSDLDLRGRLESIKCRDRSVQGYAVEFEAAARVL